MIDGGELITDRYGISSAEAVWEYVGDDPVMSIAPKIGSAHPDYGFLSLDLRRIVKASGKHTIRGSYYGVDGTPDPVYSLKVSMRDEPIETHPKFAEFATAANGAKFDPETGEFWGFFDKTKPDWHGVESYLDPGATWTETSVRSTRPNDLHDLGDRDAPSGPYPQNIGAGRNWLYIGCDYEKRGSCYTISKTWQLSGRYGWNQTIYST